MKNIKMHVKETLKNRKKVLTLIISALFLVLALTMSYSYFTSITDNSKKQETSLKTGTMSLLFKDGNNGVSGELMLGESITKKFILKNTGSLEASLSLDWKDLLNTYLDGSLTYRLVRTENNVEVEEIIPKTNMPVSDTRLTQTLASELSVPAEKEYYYDLIITFNNLDTDQESDKTAVFNTSFNVGLPLQYRYYTLVVDPNGGTWKEFTTAQSYLLKNNESLKNIENPTRVGYTFDGWELKGTSSEFTENKFTMGISDASLTAKWKPNKYNVTIDVGDGEYSGDKNLQVDYGSSITLSEPTRTGYNFTHWDVTGGTITNENTLTVTDPNNVTVTANWALKKCKYIVKHNKQNIDDDGYTTFETETELEEVDYGSTVTPEFKTYEGFKTPTEKKTITIKEDTSQNVVEYNYDRIKYTLTVDPNGGTGGTATQQVKYEKTVNLTAPTKPGYDLKNWTVESGTGTITDNTFKMGLGDTSIKANWKEQEYSLTYNANGGTVTPESKTITYASTYGELPTPTRVGYVFVGWYTTNELTGGEEITPTTTVTVTSNQTIYARWKSNTLLVVGSDAYTDKMWAHKENITKIIFENTIKEPTTYAHKYDISNVGDSSVMAYLVTDTEDSTKYVAHIQANGKIYANPNSSFLFNNFTNLKSIEGLEYFDTSITTNMGAMFLRCINIATLNVNNFDTRNVTNMQDMFWNCNNLLTLDLSNFNTINVTNMQGMIGGCHNLTTLDLSNFNTSNATNMNSMFWSCSGLTSLNINNFDTRNVTNMDAMFQRCSSLTALNVSHFNTSIVTSMDAMFHGCSSLTSLDLSNFNTSNVTNMENMFNGCSSLTTPDLSNFDTRNVTNMYGMFNECSNLTTLDLSNFNTSNVTNMASMFNGCSGLTSLDLSHFDTSNVTSMDVMFGRCSSLVTLDVSNFNTSNVTNMVYMFGGCSDLTTLNLSNFDTSNVTNMENMFNGCISLTSLNISNFNTSKVTNMLGMFSTCRSLTTLNLSNWNISSVTNKSSMFSNVPSSIIITVSNTTMRTWIIDTSDSPKLTTSNFVIA